MMKYAVLLSLIFCTFKVWAEDPKPEVSYGRSLDSKTGELLYTEKHTTEFKEGRIMSLHTEYYNLKQEKFAELKSNFKLNPYLPEYTFKDSRFGREDGTRNLKDGKKVEVFAKKNKDSDIKTTTMTVTPMLITGQGLHAYMNANLDKLIKKDSDTDIDFLIPMNQKSYNFEIRKLSVKDGKAIFKVKIRSWFLSMFAPDLEVTYEVKTRRLLIFEGPSNINSDSNDTQNVKIVYSYDKKPKDTGPNE
jgi:hypothetical protein